MVVVVFVVVVVVVLDAVVHIVCAVCVCPLHIRVQGSEANLKSHAQPGRCGPAHAPDGPYPILVLSCTGAKNLIILMHTPCLGISTIPTDVILNPQVSSKHVAEAELPKYHVLLGVQEFFCLVGLFSRLHQAH